MRYPGVPPSARVCHRRFSGVAAGAAFPEPALHDVHHPRRHPGSRRPPAPVLETRLHARHRVVPFSESRSDRADMDREGRLGDLAGLAGHPRHPALHRPCPLVAFLVRPAVDRSTASSSTRCCSGPTNGRGWCRRHGRCSRTRPRPRCNTCRSPSPPMKAGPATTASSSSPTSSPCSLPRPLHPHGLHAGPRDLKSAGLVRQGVESPTGALDPLPRDVVVPALHPGPRDAWCSSPARGSI